MTNKEYGTCAVSGCDREAVEKKICDACNEAYYRGFNMSKVRGARKTKKKLEELEEKISDFSEYDDRLFNKAQEYAEQHKRALEWVLGVRDDL